MKIIIPKLKSVQQEAYTIVLNTEENVPAWGYMSGWLIAHKAKWEITSTPNSGGGNTVTGIVLHNEFGDVFGRIGDLVVKDRNNKFDIYRRQLK